MIFHNGGLLANCRAQDLDPEDYLVEVINRLQHDAAPDQAAALTPARIAAKRRTSDSWLNTIQDPTQKV